MKKYSIIIVDDEHLARKLLEDFIVQIPELEIKGIFSSGSEALPYLENNQIDILLTDIQMPHLSGIDFIKRCQRPKTIIFTTAYSDYALDGFDLDITDYLLKPISFPRFQQAIMKSIEYLKLINNKKITDLKVEVPVKDFITIRADYKIYKIKYSQIQYIEGHSEYVKFYTPGKNITAYYTLKKLESELPQNQFIRVHKSYIVSTEMIEAIESEFVIIPGKKIPIGNRYKEVVMKYFQG
ncbi:MAG: LytTR family DNA-binding domain-containing protein [Bacteroidales bacterium]|jgi:DNA-binding LytR/AlgR family response regulator|nr:LytTR family DNA-binding domain-containing protein [Bacteroidales bacterium]